MDVSGEAGPVVFGPTLVYVRPVDPRDGNEWRCLGEVLSADWSRVPGVLGDRPAEDGGSCP